jgi:deferrochelatase/peroxidase EfeB
MSAIRIPAPSAPEEQNARRLDVRGAPATQHDALVLISGSSSDVVFEQSRAAMKAVADVADVATEQA